MTKAGLLARKRSQAISRLEAHLLKKGRGLLLLEDLAMRQYAGRKAAKGWEITLPLHGKDTRIHVLVDSYFPFSLPRIALPVAASFLKIPHVEMDGLLCLAPVHATYAVDDIEMVLDNLLESAENLLVRGATDEGRKDFAREFQSYWSYAAETESQKRNGTVPAAWSLVVPGPSSRIVACRNIGNVVLFAENAESGAAWLSNFLGEAKDLSEFSISLFLWLPAPLYPGDYPRTNDDLGRLAKSLGAKEYDLLVRVIGKVQGRLPILFGFETENGPGLGFFIANRPATISPGPRNFKQSRGFRPGNIPRDILAQRFLAATKIEKGSVVRVDTDWLLARGGDGRHDSLANKSVTLIGIGSIGSHLALMLAQSGIRKIFLVDPQNFLWENVARHLLSAKHIGLNKAVEVGKVLSERFPGSEFLGLDRRWEDLGEDSTELTAVDLIISATGEWGSEIALNALARSVSRFPNMIFGWTEPFACAGHSLIVQDIGGCLACGMNAVGRFDPTLAVWSSEGTQKRAPACGQFYEPYGMIELQHTVSLIARSALDVLQGKGHASEHRVWLGRSDYLLSNGGKWNSEWERSIGPIGEGGFERRLKWNITGACPQCRP